MTRTRWRDRPPIVERPSEWGAYALVSIGAGTVLVVALGLWFMAVMGSATGLGWWPFLPAAFMGGFLGFWCVVLVVFVAIGFARLAQRAVHLTSRFVIIAGGVLLSLTLVTTGPLALAGYPADALLPFPVIASVPAVLLAAAAVAPWRYGFARPIDPAASEHSGVR